MNRRRATGGAYDAGRMRRRILIAWDFAANGVWYIGANGTTGALFMPDTLPPRGAEGNPRPNPWRDRFSPTLRDALLAWNLDGERLWGIGSTKPSADLKRAWYARAADLAVRTQQELGAEFEVLHVIEGGAWRWATPPWADAPPR